VIRGSVTSENCHNTKALAEEIGSTAGGVPFAERDGAVPSLVHSFFQSLEGSGGVLGFMAFKGTLEVLEILGSVGNGDGQIGGFGGVERERGRPDDVERLGLRGSEAGVIKPDARILRLHDLGDGIGDEAMIGMAVAALGPPSDDDLRMKLLYEFLGVVCDGVDVFGERIGDGAKFAVVEVEKDRGLDAELLASAGGFGATRGREGFAGGNLGEVGGSLFAFGSDGEVDVDAFAGVSRKGGSSEDLVVGMGEDSEENAGVRRGILLGKEKGAEQWRSQ
jgi:hypothetical protein